jgi:hypothetical protein
VAEAYALPYNQLEIKFRKPEVLRNTGKHGEEDESACGSNKRLLRKKRVTLI